MSLAQLRAANPALAIKALDDPAFLAYGRLLDPAPFEGLLDLADRITAIDASGNRYVASVPELEAHPAVARLGVLFGGMPLQVGYCNGPNSKLNGLEYHKGPEVTLAVTDLCVILGKKRDIGPDLSYESRRAEVFYVPAGTVYELASEVLHYSPCRVHPAGFKSLIVLPRGTNDSLEGAELKLARDLGRPGEAGADPEARLLLMRNKWILAHPERTLLVERGAWPGIKGENLEVRTI